MGLRCLRQLRVLYEDQVTGATVLDAVDARDRGVAALPGLDDCVKLAGNL